MDDTGRNREGQPAETHGSRSVRAECSDVALSLPYRRLAEIVVLPGAGRVQIGPDFLHKAHEAVQFILENSVKFFRTDVVVEVDQPVAVAGHGHESGRQAVRNHPLGAQTPGRECLGLLGSRRPEMVRRRLPLRRDFQMDRLSDSPSRADLGPDLVAKGFVSREAVEEVFELLFGHLRNLAGGRG